jgi:DNA-directed RNA polymerase subunit beta'
LLGLKENVIVGHLIPSGTGVRSFQNMIVASKEDYEAMSAK